MDDFDREIKVCFLDEATQALAEVEQCFLSLESNPKDQGNLDNILRLAHNLKGSSRAVGFEELATFTHELEAFVLKIKKGKLEPNANVVNLLLQANDFVSHIIQELKKDVGARFNIQKLILEMKSCESNPGPAPEQIVESVQPQFIKEIGEMPQPKHSIAAPTSPAVADQNIRVALSKVEKLINYVGEMVIIQSVLHEQAAESISLEFKKSVHQLGKITKEIQEIAMGLRMVPIKPTFQKMVRIVRDTSLTLQKDIQLHLEGEDTELDKTVLERINDPLTHLIRNAVDHGVETTDARNAVGKATTGHIYLKAYHRSGRLIIEVSDDGGGIDSEKIVSKAIEKGILQPGTKLQEKDAYQLIFAPGFSTKEVVTDISGRGVGMDVVKTNITDLGGEIVIHSKKGQGTTFLVSLPLTLAIIESMIISYSSQKFIVPLSHVHETVPAKDYKIQHATGIGDVILLRGENLRLIRLGDFFGIPSYKPNEEMIAIVVRTGAEPFAILVDDILGQHQVVVKQLSHDLSGFTGVSGTTILGDGRPALILELQDLLKRKIIQSFSLKKIEGDKAV